MNSSADPSKMSSSTKSHTGPRYWSTWLLIGMMRISAWLPYPILLILGTILGKLMYWLLGERRKIAKINLNLCFPELPEKQQKKLQKACFQNIGIAVFETAAAWWGSDKKLHALCRIQGLHHITEAQKQNKSILLLSGHMSCTEIGARLLAMHIPFQAMYKPAKNKLFESFMLKQRSRYYHEMVPRKKSRRLLYNLKHKIITWYAPDQNFGHNETVFAPFFGIPATTLTATARIAGMMDTAVIPFFPYRLPGTQGYQLIIGKPLNNFPTGDNEQDAATVNKVIEDAVRLAPDQYLWVHKRFRIQPPGQKQHYR